MIKAVAGGGGRGMRVAHNDISLVKGYHTARNEAEKAFGNSGVYIEKFIENPPPHRISDPRRPAAATSSTSANAIAPSSGATRNSSRKPLRRSSTTSSSKLRDKMGKAAVRIAEVAHYTNAGTVEFIVDDQGNFYFLEVNKRIQVEHPITEEVTGIDLVRYQIMIAMGEPLRHSQGDIEFKGHAIECRINAEDPFDEFRPCPGRIEMYYAPGGRGVRVDTHAYAGYTIPAHYDSMIGKLITYRQRPPRSHGQNEPRPRRIHDHRRQNHHLLSAGHSAGPQLPPRRLLHQLHRATPQRRPPRIDRRKSLTPCPSGNTFPGRFPVTLQKPRTQRRALLDFDTRFSPSFGNSTSGIGY